MKFQQLRYLVAVHENGLNITAAARQLHTSQPGVSRQLKLLEEANTVVKQQSFQMKRCLVRDFFFFVCRVLSFPVFNTLTVGQRQAHGRPQALFQHAL